MLDWDKFTEISGNAASARDNFERLCRHVIKRTYGYLGPFKERKNQPGVEFFVELHEDEKSLAKKGQKVGWQCKWFDYDSSGNLRSGSKTKIKESLKKTTENVADLNIWILCTHRTLSKKDQDWFYDLQTGFSFELWLWNESDIEELLKGENSDLYQTYFGNLAFTRKIAEEAHAQSISPIAKRWNHQLHNEIDEENEIRKVLGEPSAWSGIEESQVELIELHKSISDYLDRPEYVDSRNSLSTFLEQAYLLIERCNVFKDQISMDDVNSVLEFIKRDLLEKEVHFVLRMLRKKNLELSLYLTNAIAVINDLKLFLKKAIELLNHQLIFLIANAGGGKTHFSAEITSPNESRPAGVFLRGHYLSDSSSLNDLAKRVSVSAKPIESFELLLSALNSFGERENCRIPVVIDGLNEAQDPRDWSGLLEEANTQLKKYPNVVLLCTLRPKIEADRFYPGAHKGYESIAAHSIPEGALVLHSEGFSDQVTSKAVEAYFHHYKIKADPHLIPLNFFKHPLNLKTFCEVTNPSAESEVIIKSFPSSIYSLYTQQIINSANRIAELSNLSIKYQVRDVENAIYDLGELFWKSGSRVILESDFFALNKSDQSDQSDWEANIVNLLVQEGLIFREEKTRRDFMLMPAYDRLGGFLIAQCLITHGQGDFKSLVKSEEFESKIFGRGDKRHHLSEDILCALVVLAPKLFYGKNLWKFIGDNFDTEVLALSYLIDADDLDEEVIDAYKDFLAKKMGDSDLKMLLPLQKVMGHPFNGWFLNDLLCEMSLPDRDLIVTEYYRGREKDISSALKDRMNLWDQNKFDDFEVERLRIVQICWMLSSTNKEFRNTVTKTLFHFGLKQPDIFLGIVSNLLKVNDLYVVERLLASSYGVIGTLTTQGVISESIPKFVILLYEQMFSKHAESSTTHINARDYASCIIEVFNLNHPGFLSSEQLKNCASPFKSMPRVSWHELDPKSISSYCDNPFRMDFENYTIGRLIPGRGGYDYDHPEYLVIRNKILWRVFELGWSGDKFSKIDEIISSEHMHSRVQGPNTERYGKKYSWIAYHEMAGELSDKDLLELDGVRFNHDIDPFFTSINTAPFEDSHLYLGYQNISAEEWVSEDFEKVNFESFEKDILEGDAGPWIILSGCISANSKLMNRDFFQSINCFFIHSHDRSRLDDALDSEVEINVPERVSLYSVFLGEVYGIKRDHVPNVSSISVWKGYENREVSNIDFSDLYFLDGEIVTRAESTDKTKIIQISIYDEFECYLSSIDYQYEHESKQNTNLRLLPPWIVKSLNLSFDPITTTYYDSEGKMAGKLINEHTSFNRSENSLFLRKDLFEKLLVEQSLSLLASVILEKRLDNLANEKSPQEGRHFLRDSYLFLN